jgi:hypothetical protein
MPASEHTVFSNLKLKKRAGGIFCDLAKTFDNVYHEILPVQLLYMAIKD